MFEVDVLIPFHRNDELVRAAVQSAHLSSNVALRIIAVNDTHEEITARDLGLKELDLLIRTTSRGYLNAMRTAVENSTAEFVCFLDSDDLISKNKIYDQINHLIAHNFDFISCDMATIDVNGSVRRPREIFGKVPLSIDPRALWLIGSHGADSTLMCRGPLLRSTWDSHSKFAAHFADYGWALSLSDSVVLGHLPVAHYFYRSHPNQISRDASLGQSWAEIHKLWVENFFKCFPGIERQFEISENIAISLAFPAALKRLRRGERKVLKIMISSILFEISKQEGNDQRSWKRTLYRRGFIATRGLTFRYWLESIPLAVLIMLEFKNGMQIRRIRRG
jgi:glycosyltransferase involved in cell wall biosynthesis